MFTPAANFQFTHKIRRKSVTLSSAVIIAELLFLIGVTFLLRASTFSEGTFMIHHMQNDVNMFL